MTKEDYDNIANCIQRRGTRTQRKALKGLMNSVGWDCTHGYKLLRERMEKENSKLHEEIFLLRSALRKNGIAFEYDELLRD